LRQLRLGKAQIYIGLGQLGQKFLPRTLLFVAGSRNPGHRGLGGREVTAAKGRQRDRQLAYPNVRKITMLTGQAGRIGKSHTRCPAIGLKLAQPRVGDLQGYIA
jgi:hypothetical protein